MQQHNGIALPRAHVVDLLTIHESHMVIEVGKHDSNASPRRRCVPGSNGIHSPLVYGRCRTRVTRTQTVQISQPARTRRIQK